MFSFCSDASTEEDLKEELLPSSRSHLRYTPRSHKSFWHWTFHATSVCLLLALGAHSTWRKMSYEVECMLKHDTWSPGLEALRNTFSTETVLGTFDAWTPYKGPPTPNVNAAWDRLINVSTVSISHEEMIRMNRPLSSVKYPNEISQGYMAQTAAIHQLHCLHLIWRDHHLHQFPEYESQKSVFPEYYEQHYEHCVDMIRQRLMCTADPGVVTFRWVKGVPGPYPDFNVQRKCRDFEALLEWDERVGVDVPGDSFDWKPPEGSEILDTKP